MYDKYADCTQLYITWVDTNHCNTNMQLVLNLLMTPPNAVSQIYRCFSTSHCTSDGQLHIAITQMMLNFSLYSNHQWLYHNYADGTPLYSTFLLQSTANLQLILNLNHLTLQSGHPHIAITKILKNGITDMQMALDIISNTY